MNLKNQKKIYIAYSVFLTLILINPAYSYLDPGAGSAVLQGVIAAIAAVAVAVKLYWHKILVLLRIRKKIDISEKKTADVSETAADKSQNH